MSSTSIDMTKKTIKSKPVKSVRKPKKPTKIEEGAKSIFEDAFDDETEMCQICCTNKRAYRCPSCKYAVCNDCLKEYILKYSNLTPHCAQCQAVLPFLVICQALGKNGVKEFFKRSSELKFEIEKQMMPECMDCCDELNTLASIQSLPMNVRQFLIAAAKPPLSVKSNIVPESAGPELVKFANEYADEMDDLAITYRVNAILALSQRLKELRENENLHPKPKPSTPTVTKEEPTDEAPTLTKRPNKAMMKEPFAKPLAEVDSVYLPYSNMWGKILMPSDNFSYYTSQVSMPEVRFWSKDFDRRLQDAFSTITNISLQKFKALAANNSTSFKEVIERHKSRNENKQLGKATKAEFMFRCSKDECKGFVNSNFECQLCHSHYCPQCFKMISGEHVCDPADIETAKMLLKDTKPCPNCAARIFKISGCSQMFCTNCHVGFDWNTGKLIKTNFHNPHRMEWIQQRIRAGESIEPDDQMNDHGGCADMEGYITMCPKLYQYSELDYRMNQMRHFRSVCISKWTTSLRDVGADDFRNRCLYMLNQIDDDEYKEYLNKTVHDKYKYEMIVGIYSNFVDLIQQIAYVGCSKIYEFRRKIDKLPLNKKQGVSLQYSQIDNVWNIIITRRCETVIGKLLTELKNDPDFGELKLDDIFCVIEDKHIEGLGKAFRDVSGLTAQQLIDLFKDVPSMDREFELMNEITNETVNSIKYYKHMFGISSITMPINRDSRTPYTYYRVK